MMVCHYDDENDEEMFYPDLVSEHPPTSSVFSSLGVCHSVRHDIIINHVLTSVM